MACTREKGIAVYTSAKDTTRGLLVGIWSEATNSADDFDRHAADMLAVDRGAAAIGVPMVTIIEADPENERPNAADRRRLSEAAKAADAAPAHFLTLVTKSAIARGVVTAVAWLMGPSGNRTLTSHATFDDALIWTESKRPGIAPQLVELYREVRSRIDTNRRGSGTIARAGSLGSLGAVKVARR